MVRSHKRQLRPQREKPLTPAILPQGRPQQQAGLGSEMAARGVPESPYSSGFHANFATVPAYQASSANHIQPSDTKALSGCHGSVVQRKMVLGNAGDRYEDEADRWATKIVGTIHAPDFRPPATIRPGGQSIARPLNAMPTPLQLKANRAGATVSSTIESAITRKKGRGQPLDAGLQQSIGQAMGADFSRVQVHTDGQSDRLNQSMQSKAFTTGQDVFFRQGEYQPKSRAGQELIAHELAHVVQQQRGLPLQQGQATASTTIQRLTIEENNTSVTLTAKEAAERYIRENSEAYQTLVTDVTKARANAYVERLFLKIDEWFDEPSDWESVAETADNFVKEAPRDDTLETVDFDDWAEQSEQAEDEGTFQSIEKIDIKNVTFLPQNHAEVSVESEGLHVSSPGAHIQAKITLAQTGGKKWRIGWVQNVIQAERRFEYSNKKTWKETLNVQALDGKDNTFWYEIQSPTVDATDQEGKSWDPWMLDVPATPLNRQHQPLEDLTNVTGQDTFVAWIIAVPEAGNSRPDVLHHVNWKTVWDVNVEPNTVEPGAAETKADSGTKTTEANGKPTLGPNHNVESSGNGEGIGSVRQVVTDKFSFKEVKSGWH